jgi:hypothetical protein
MYVLEVEQLKIDWKVSNLGCRNLHTCTGGGCNVIGKISASFHA